jgi:hypothetical protein
VQTHPQLSRRAPVHRLPAPAPELEEATRDTCCHPQWGWARFTRRANAPYR